MRFCAEMSLPRYFSLTIIPTCLARHGQQHSSCWSVGNVHDILTNAWILEGLMNVQVSRGCDWAGICHDRSGDQNVVATLRTSAMRMPQARPCGETVYMPSGLWQKVRWSSVPHQMVQPLCCSLNNACSFSMLANAKETFATLSSATTSKYFGSRSSAISRSATFALSCLQVVFDASPFP